ncbi:RNA polymerase sigma factor [Paraclostridium sp. AKS81]|uniref:RNA polymerase sigma factor n=1 Tax=Paraclostridium sp. AKS81 TaxID=2876117 RepID=UPI0021E0557D|nr:RNA polymerase sigma factor [Paraclostridium sp. AKS81]MCU9811775.1 RNA polymerase sigma factor [Paraclostridium sp. AKS81]
MAQSDEKLIKEILKGNESAMEVLVKRYYDMVHSFVYRNVNDYNIAYDITQESFIKMMKNIDKYKLKEGNFKSWLLKIALNTTKDYFKSKIYNQRKRSDDISNYEIEDKANVIDILSKKKRLLR